MTISDKLATAIDNYSIALEKVRSLLEEAGKEGVVLNVRVLPEDMPLRDVARFLSELGIK